jgi:XTP/dITP diphosphohydrolase
MGTRPQGDSPSLPFRPLVLATGNRGKVLEFQALLAPAGFTLLTPADLGFSAEIEETGDTFLRNALIKAEALAAHSPHPVLADDSGLEVDVLGGAPGVYSARYASASESWTDPTGKPLVQAAANRAKLLKALQGEDQRRARFRCVLCYLIPGRKPEYFEGVCEGGITRQETGEGGFGYDPLFIPSGHGKTFGELPAEVKDAISHRGKAAAAFLDFLAQAKSD